MAAKEYKFGISTTVDYSIEISILLELFARYEFDFISISSFQKHNLFPDVRNFSTIAALAAKNKLRIDSIHVPFGENYDIADPEKSGRLNAIEAVLRFLDYVSAINIPIAIIHPHHFIRDSKQQTLERSTVSLEKITAQKPGNIRFAVENLPDRRGSWIADKLLDIFDQTQLGFCYDSSHENMSGEPFHLLKKHFGRLVTCHLSDNFGINDDHLVPGDGLINWSELKNYMDKAKRFNNILFEVGTGEKLAVSAEDYIRRTAQAAKNIFG